MEKGRPKGFGRIIAKYDFNYSFIGYFEDWRTISSGTGLFFKDLKLLYSGIYQNDTPYDRSPAIIKDFSTFTYVNP